MHPSLVQPTPELIDAIPEPIARRFELLPVLLSDGPRGRTLWIVTADPSRADALEACARASGLPVRAMSAPLEEIRSSFHRWYGGAPPKPATPPPRRPISILELEAVSVETVPPSPPKRAATVLVVQASSAFARACREAFAAESVEVREIDLLEAGNAARDLTPFAIVVPDDVYHFDPTAFSTLATGARALLITAESADASHLAPLLKTAFRSFF